MRLLCQAASPDRCPSVCTRPAAQLGDEVKSAFIATLNTSAAKVVRGVLLTRPGYEEKAAGASSLQVRRQRAGRGGVQWGRAEGCMRGEAAAAAVLCLQRLPAAAPSPPLRPPCLARRLRS